MKYVLAALVLIVFAVLGMMASGVLVSLAKGALHDYGDPSMFECLAVLGFGVTGGVALGLWVLQRAGAI